jgi:rhodanese-related sulfurtransferase
VYPAHGAGSSCGRQLSAETSSTIAEQRRTNYALQPMSEDDFVALVTEGQPPRPHYFEFDARRNRQVHPLLDDATPPPLLDVDEVADLKEQGAQLLDAREPPEFATGHLAGAVNVSLQGRFAEWAGDVLDPHADVVLVGDADTSLEQKVRLGRVGFDRVVGQLRALPEALRERPELGETSSRLTIRQLTELLDVRNPSEAAGGTLPGARELPLAVIVDALDGLDRSAPTVTYCASGYRSVVAASLLRAAGFADVSDLLGGFTAWANAGLPVVAGGGSDHGVRCPSSSRPPRGQLP